MTGPHTLRSCRLVLCYVPDVETIDGTWPEQRCGVYYVRLDDPDIPDEDGVPLGAISITGLARMVGEIGYLIAPAFQGQGFATEAVQAVVGAIYKHHGFTVVTARARADNIASQAVLAKCGFTPASAKLTWNSDSDAAVHMRMFRRVECQLPLDLG